MEIRVLDYNKQIAFSELGSIIGGPVAGTIASLLSTNNSTISFITVAGAVIGSSLMWLLLRILYDKRRGVYSFHKLKHDVLYFAPAASILAILFVYPTIFFGTRTLLDAGVSASIASFVGPFVGFLVFILVMNVYRITLERFWDIKL